MIQETLIHIMNGIDNALLELRQIHSHFHSHCLGGCPTLDAIKRLEDSRGLIIDNAKPIGYYTSLHDGCEISQNVYGQRPIPANMSRVNLQGDYIQILIRVVGGGLGWINVHRSELK